MKYIPLFVLVQALSICLQLLGLLPIFAMSFQITPQPYGPTYFPHRWAWIWDNEEDGVCPPWYLMAHNSRPLWLNVFVWAALRNPAANLKHVYGVSAAGRPLWYKTKMMFNKQFYFKAGWLSNGYPCLSAGAGKGY